MTRTAFAFVFAAVLALSSMPSAGVAGPSSADTVRDAPVSSAGVVRVADRTRVFNAPRVSGYRLDWCLRWAEACGKPAADAFCVNNGFQYAVGFTPAPDIGARSPTMVLSSRQICNEPFCDGFRSITCGARGGGGGGRPENQPCNELFGQTLPPGHPMNTCGK